MCPFFKKDPYVITLYCARARSQFYAKRDSWKMVNRIVWKRCDSNSHHSRLDAGNIQCVYAKTKYRPTQNISEAGRIVEKSEEVEFIRAANCIYRTAETYNANNLWSRYADLLFALISSIFRGFMDQCVRRMATNLELPRSYPGYHHEITVSFLAHKTIQSV